MPKPSFVGPCRAIFDADLEPCDAIEQLDQWCPRAQQSRLPAFVKVARTMRDRRRLIVNELEHGLSNGRFEGLNTKVRLVIDAATASTPPPPPSPCSPADPSPSPCPTNTKPVRPPRAHTTVRRAVGSRRERSTFV